MRSYTIQRVAQTPDWATLDRLPIDRLHKTAHCDVSAVAQLSYDDERLWVRLEAQERAIRAEERGPLGMPCEDSCLEFFFCPVEGDIRYINMEYNPNACLYLGLGSCIEDLTRLLPDDAEQLFAPRVTRSSAGWAVEYQVPYAFIRRFFPAFAPVSGTMMRANCYKCGDLTEQPHYLAWSRIEGERLTFHSPQYFGLMRFA